MPQNTSNTNKKPPSLQQQFIDAAENGDIKKMGELLTKNPIDIDINEQGNVQNYNALAAAIRIENPQTALATIQFLFEHGADAKEPAAQPPLVTAVSRNDPKIVEELLKHGADPRREMARGRPDADDDEMADARNYKGVTPMDMFSGNPDVFKLLMDYDQKLHEPIKNKLPSLLEHRAQNGFTPLMNLVSLPKLPKPEAVKFLLQNGADPKATVKFRGITKTALTLAQDDVKFLTDTVSDMVKEEADPKNKPPKSGYNHINSETGESPHQQNARLIKEIGQEIQLQKAIIGYIKETIPPAVPNQKQDHAVPQKSKPHAMINGYQGKQVAFAKDFNDLPKGNGIHTGSRRQKPEGPAVAPAALVAAAASAAYIHNAQPSVPGPGRV